MPRTARASVGGIGYHVINRGNRQATVFHKTGDYDAFVKLLHTSRKRLRMRLLAYCVMPNHFHAAVWPQADGDLSRSGCNGSSPRMFAVTMSTTIQPGMSGRDALRRSPSKTMLIC